MARSSSGGLRGRLVVHFINRKNVPLDFPHARGHYLQITVTGLEGGATVASDTYSATLSGTSFVWVTQDAINLANQTLDELRIVLPGEFSGEAGTKFLQSTVDNVVLDALPGRVAVPEPATLTLLGAGLLGLSWRRRQRV